MSDFPNVDRILRRFQQMGYTPEQIAGIVNGAVSDKELAHAMIQQSSIGDKSSSHLSATERDAISSRFEKHHTDQAMYYSRGDVAKLEKILKSYAKAETEVKNAGYTGRDAKTIASYNEKIKPAIERVAPDTDRLNYKQIKAVTEAAGRGTTYMSMEIGIEKAQQIIEASKSINMARVPKGFFSDPGYSTGQVGNQTKRVIRGAGLATTSRPDELMRREGSDAATFRSVINSASFFSMLKESSAISRQNLFGNPLRVQRKQSPQYTVARQLPTYRKIAKPVRYDVASLLAPYRTTSPVKQQKVAPVSMTYNTRMQQQAKDAIREINVRNALKNIQAPPTGYLDALKAQVTPKVTGTPTITRKAQPQQSWFQRNKNRILDAAIGIGGTAGLVGVSASALSGFMTHGIPMPFKSGGSVPTFEGGGFIQRLRESVFGKKESAIDDAIRVSIIGRKVRPGSKNSIMHRDMVLDTLRPFYNDFKELTGKHNVDINFGTHYEKKGGIVTGKYDKSGITLYSAGINKIANMKGRNYTDVLAETLKHEWLHTNPDMVNRVKGAYATGQIPVTPLFETLSNRNYKNQPDRWANEYNSVFGAGWDKNERTHILNNLKYLQTRGYFGNEKINENHIRQTLQATRAWRKAFGYARGGAINPFRGMARLVHYQQPQLSPGAEIANQLINLQTMTPGNIGDGFAEGGKLVSRLSDDRYLNQLGRKYIDGMIPEKKFTGFKIPKRASGGSAQNLIRVSNGELGIRRDQADKWGGTKGLNALNSGGFHKWQQVTGGGTPSSYMFKGPGGGRDDLITLNAAQNPSTSMDDIIYIIKDSSSEDYLKHMNGGTVSALRGYANGGSIPGYKYGTPDGLGYSKRRNERYDAAEEKYAKDLEYYNTVTYPGYEARDDANLSKRRPPSLPPKEPQINPYIGGGREVTTSVNKNDPGKHPKYFSDAAGNPKLAESWYDDIVDFADPAGMYSAGLDTVKDYDALFQDPMNLYKGLLGKNEFKSIFTSVISPDKTISHKSKYAPHTQEEIDALKGDKSKQAVTTLRKMIAANKKSNKPVAATKADLSTFIKGSPGADILNVLNSKRDGEYIFGEMRDVLKHDPVEMLMANPTRYFNQRSGMMKSANKAAFERTYAPFTEEQIATSGRNAPRLQMANAASGKPVAADEDELYKVAPYSRELINSMKPVTAAFQKMQHVVGDALGKFAATGFKATGNMEGLVDEDNAARLAKFEKQKAKYIDNINKGYATNPLIGVNEEATYTKQEDQFAYRAAKERASQGYRTKPMGVVGGLTRIVAPYLRDYFGAQGNDEEIAQRMHEQSVNNPLARLFRQGKIPHLPSTGNIRAGINAFSTGFLNEQIDKKDVYTGKASFGLTTGIKNIEILSGEKTQADLNEALYKNSQAIKGKQGGIEADLKDYVVRETDVFGIGKLDAESMVNTKFVDSWETGADGFIESTTAMETNLGEFREKLKEFGMGAKEVDTFFLNYQKKVDETLAKYETGATSTGKKSTVDVQRQGIWETGWMKASKVTQGLSWKAASISMSSMGVYFSLSGVMMQLQGALNQVMGSLSDLNTVFQNVGYVSAFAGGMGKVTDILKKFEVSQNDLVKGWQNVQGVQATFGLSMSALAARIFTTKDFSDGLNAAIGELFNQLADKDMLATFVTLITSAANAMPALVDAIKMIAPLLEFIGKNQWLITMAAQIMAITMLVQPLTSGISLFMGAFGTGAEIMAMLNGISAGFTAIGMTSTAALVSILPLIALAVVGLEALGAAVEALGGEKIRIAGFSIRASDWMFGQGIETYKPEVPGMYTGGVVPVPSRDMVPGSPDDTIAALQSGETVLPKGYKMPHYATGTIAAGPLMPSMLKPFDAQAANENRALQDPLSKSMAFNMTTSKVLGDAKNGNAINVVVQNMPANWGAQKEDKGFFDNIPWPDIGSLFPSKLYGLGPATIPTPVSTTPSPPTTPTATPQQLRDMQSALTQTMTPSHTPTPSPTTIVELLVAAVQNATGLITTGLMSAFDAIYIALGKAATTIGDITVTISDLGPTISTVISSIKSGAGSASTTIKSDLGQIVSGITHPVDTAKAGISAMTGALKGGAGYNTQELWAQHGGYRNYGDIKDYGNQQTKRNAGFMDWFTTGGYNKQNVPGPTGSVSIPAKSFDTFKKDFFAAYSPIAQQNKKLVGTPNEIDNYAESLFLESNLRKEHLGSNIDAHGIAKGTLSNQLGSLDNLINNGVDTTKRFHTTSLIDYNGAGAGTGAAGGAYTHGAFTLLSKPGDSLVDKSGKTNIGAVLVNREQEKLISQLREQYKGTNFITHDQVADYNKGSLDLSTVSIPKISPGQKSMTGRKIYTPWEKFIPDKADWLQPATAAVSSNGNPYDTALGVASMHIGNLVTGVAGDAVQRAALSAPAAISKVIGEGTVRNAASVVAGKGLAGVGTAAGRAMQLSGTAPVVMGTGLLTAGKTSDDYFSGKYSAEAIKKGAGKNEFAGLVDSGLFSAAFGKGMQVWGGMSGKEDTRMIADMNKSGILDIGLSGLWNTALGKENVEGFGTKLKGGNTAVSDMLRSNLNYGIGEEVPLVGGLNLGGSLADANSGIYDMIEQLANLDVGNIFGFGTSMVGLGATGVDLAKNTAGAIAENPYTAAQLALTAGTPGGFGALLAPLLMPQTTTSLDNASAQAAIQPLTDLPTSLGSFDTAIQTSTANLNNNLPTNETPNDGFVTSSNQITLNFTINGGEKSENAQAIVAQLKAVLPDLLKQYNVNTSSKS